MPSSRQQRTDAVAARLAAAGCVAADEEAEELVSGAPDDDVLWSWVARREVGEPLAWITGTTRFCGLVLGVDPGVYVPRPQTEELARRAVSLLGATGGRAADLCTGAGAVAAHLGAALPGAVVVATDIDPAACACARRNGVDAVRGDVDAPLASGAFSVVTAVAPYVPTGELAFLPADVVRYEPGRALDGGGDGLGVARRVVAGAARVLCPGGWLVLELGGEQDGGLAPALVAHGFGDVGTWRDGDGDLRGLTARLLAPPRR